MKHECPNCGCKFAEATLSEKPFCPVDDDGCKEEPTCRWPCKKLGTEDLTPVSESVALDLLKEARPYLDLIAPSVSKERPLVMVVTKCDAEALAKRIDALIGEKA